MSVVFITGASRGFGAELTRIALERGHQVVATARDARTVVERFPDAGPSLFAVALDVTSEEQARAAAKSALQRFGRIDVLINNAGRGLLGAVEEATDEEVRAVFDTNVFGLLNVTRAVAPTFREQRSGHIINISSVGGFVGSPGWGIYAATKFAVEGLSEAMRGETSALGIAVTIVEPGYFRTDFLDSSSLRTVATPIADYTTGPAGTMRARAATVNHAQPGDPVKAAGIILDLAVDADAPSRIQLGIDSLSAIRAKLARVEAEAAVWEHVSVTTDDSEQLRQV